MEEKTIILGVPFDIVTLKSATEKVEQFSRSNEQIAGEPRTKQFHIATPNPEILLEAQKNKPFRKILQNTALNIPDGIGIIWASYWNYFRGKTPKLKERVTGTDLMAKIIEKTNDPSSPLFQKKIFLLGAREGAGAIIKEKFLKKFPAIQISGTYSGSPLPNEEEKIIKLIQNSDAEILFVAFGAPAQEFWIHKNLHKLPKIKIAMGVGGAFNFFANIQKRAPQWMQKSGLEWLFRLIQEPKRIKRIYNAVIRFPVKFLLHR